MNVFKKKRILVPITVLLMLIAAYAQKNARAKTPISGKLQDEAMDEISGIAASSVFPGVYYVHNDSGDTSRFFAITPTGKLKATIYFNAEKAEKFGVRDCEDIAVGPGPVKGKSYVYMGDIGDNNSSRKYIAIHRMVEPASVTGKDSILHAHAEALFLKYPDGSKDAETMMVDPIEQLIYIVSKRKDTIKIYTTPLNYHAGDTLMLNLRAKLHFNGLLPFKWITAGDISKDGKQILLKSYVKVYYWQRKGDEPVWQTMQGKPQELPYQQEKQGEAIGFTPDGKGYYTTSEGKYVPIYYYSITAKKK